MDKREISQTVKKKDSFQYRSGFKFQLIESIVSDREPESSLARSYGIRTSTLSNLKKQLLETEGYFRILNSMKRKKEESPTAEELSAENAKLKKALELAMLKVAGLETLIEVAEEELKVEIRKKSGVKQSK